ncbi:MAG: WbqC family protein, partial [Geobacteraceae bacterium]|nr:WbqC family protein [Geobacteraceae bacterium]
MRTIAVLQSNYIPWKGYFDLVNDVDLFVFYDDLQ